MRDWTVHGGRVGEARIAYPDAPLPWLDLSTGVNPHPWPGAAAMAFDWRALPDDRALLELEAAAADHFGAKPAAVCALPGTEIGLRLLDGLALPPPFRHLTPAYRTHGEALSGSIAVDPSALIAEAARGGTLLLANPNNPDGRIIPVEDLLRAASLLAVAGGCLVVDEAFADATPGASIVPRIDAASAPVLVFRSFGKFFGLAGLRLGFAVGPARWIAPLRRRIGSWPVSSAALAIGAAAYRDRDWIAAMRAALTKEATALDTVLGRHGLSATGHSPLFRLVKTPDAPARFDRLMREGILTRPFDHAPDWLRFGLPGSEEALARLDRALALG